MNRYDDTIRAILRLLSGAVSTSQERQAVAEAAKEFERKVAEGKKR